MKLFFALLFAACSMSAFEVKAQVTGEQENWKVAERQVIDYLVDKHVDYNVIYDARDFGLPAPDSLTLKAADGFGIFAYEVCPKQPKGVVICLSGIENPSVTAFYGHAAEFYKANVATIMPDLRGHGKSDGNRICLAYEEARDVKTVTDYIKSNAKYKDIPVIVLGVSMGGAVAIRSIGENKDIDGLIALSAFSSLEDFLQASREAFLPMIPAEQLAGITRQVVKEKYGVDSSVNSPLYALLGLNNRPVLMMHSRQDSQVPYSCFEKLATEASKYTLDLDTMTVEGDEHFICKDFTKPSADKEYMRQVMRFIRKLTSSHPYVKTEEGVELMEIVARFADNTVFNDSIAPLYQKDCDQWFAALKDHPAVVWLHDQLPVYCIGYEAIPWLGAHLRCTENGLELIPNANKQYKRWP